MSVIVPFLHVVCGLLAWFTGAMLLGDVLFRHKRIKDDPLWWFVFFCICFVTVITTDSIGRGVFNLLLFPIVLITGSL